MATYFFVPDHHYIVETVRTKQSPNDTPFIHNNYDVSICKRTCCWQKVLVGVVDVVVGKRFLHESLTSQLLSLYIHKHSNRTPQKNPRRTRTDSTKPTQCLRVVGSILSQWEHKLCDYLYQSMLLPKKYVNSNIQCWVPNACFCLKSFLSHFLSLSLSLVRCCPIHVVMTCSNRKILLEETSSRSKASSWLREWIPHVDK